MSILSFFLKRKPISNLKESIIEIQIGRIICNGDLYVYKIPAKDRSDAFKKLVEYFVSNKSNEIKSTSGIVSQPQHDRWISIGCPYWFARWVSGEGTDKDYAELEKYKKENNI